MPIALISFSGPSESKYPNTTSLQTLFRKAFTSTVKDGPSKIKTGELFDLVWNKLKSKEENVPQFIQSTKLTGAQDTLKYLPALYKIAYSLDLIEIINQKHQEVLAFKDYLNITKQQLNVTAKELIEKHTPPFNVLIKKATTLALEVQNKIADYQAELENDFVINQKYKELNQDCEDKLNQLADKLSAFRKKTEELNTQLATMTDGNFSSTDLLEELKKFEREINEIHLPAMPSLEKLFNRSNVTKDYRLLRTEIAKLMRDNSSLVTKTKSIYHEVETTLEAIKSDTILTRDDSLCLSDFMVNFLEKDHSFQFKIINSELIKAFSGEPEFVVFINKLFNSIKDIVTDSVRLTISENLVERNKLNNEATINLPYRTSVTVTHSPFATEFAELEADFKQKNDTLRRNYFNLKHLYNTAKPLVENKEYKVLELHESKITESTSIYREKLETKEPNNITKINNIRTKNEAGYENKEHKRTTIRKSKIPRPPSIFREKLEAIEQNIINKFNDLRTKKEAEKNSIANQCKTLISTIESINIAKIISENKKREEERQQRIRQKTLDAEKLALEIERQNLIAEEKDYKPTRSIYPLYKNMSIASGLCGIGATIAGIIGMISNPIGWGLGLLIAGAAFFTATGFLIKKAYTHYKRKIHFDNISDDHERKKALIQDRVLETEGLSPTSRNLLIKLGARTTKNISPEGDILCELDAEHQKQLGTSTAKLHLDRPTGHLYFVRRFQGGMEKVSIDPNKDIPHQLARLAR